MALLAEWVCDLAESIAVVVHCSHVNPLLRVLTRYIARKPAIWSVGGAAHTHIIGPTCALAGSRAHERAKTATYRVSVRDKVCRFAAHWATRIGELRPCSPRLKDLQLVSYSCAAGEKRCTTGTAMPYAPPQPQQPAPQRKALIKGKRPPVKAVTSLDNGRKWRVYAARTLELLR